MEFNFESLAAKVANRVLDEFEFNGKTIRAWADTLTYPKTNADRIRSMSDEKLAELISERIDCCECEHMYVGEGKPCHNGKTCPDYWLDWLKQEAEP